MHSILLGIEPHGAKYLKFYLLCHNYLTFHDAYAIVVVYTITKYKAYSFHPKHSKSQYIYLFVTLFQLKTMSMLNIPYVTLARLPIKRGAGIDFITQLPNNEIGNPTPKINAVPNKSCNRATF